MDRKQPPSQERRPPRMKRDLAKLANTEFDVVIIGGGIYGAAALWEAASRGLTAALVERGDFGHANSANSQKIIHGGFRYLQHADFKRLRESVKERSILMRIAPHLIHPLPVLVPTYGHGLKSKEIIALALKMYDCLSFDRNRSLTEDKHIPSGEILSKEQVLDWVPCMPAEGLTGGGVFYDAQVYNSERLTLAFIQSAVSRGACAANYAECVGFDLKNNRVAGVNVRDIFTKDTFTVRGRNFINTSGPWVFEMLRKLDASKFNIPFPLVKSFNVISRTLSSKAAFGLYGKNQYVDQDALLDKGSRLFFITPWRDHSVIGTSLTYYDKNPENLFVSEEEITQFLKDFNEACPKARIERKDITMVHKGFLPSKSQSPVKDVQVSKHYRILDHSKEGFQGLISVIGVKYTTARDVMKKTLDRICESLGKTVAESQTSKTPLWGAPDVSFAEFLRSEKKPESAGIPHFESLLKNYGSEYRKLLKMAEVSDASRITETQLKKSQILYAVKEEMAVKMSDVIFRRTEWGTLGHPGPETLEFAGRIMAEELKWNSEKIKQETQEVHALFPFMY
jgi:glycerol-3-phosphate dehydrogenase